MPKISCVDCGFLGWGFTSVNPESALWGANDTEVTVAQRAELRQGQGRLTWVGGAEFDRRAYLGCYQNEWIELMYLENKEEEERLREEILKKRDCASYVAFKPHLNPEKHLKMRAGTGRRRPGKPS
jgi:hypothetical protein